MLWPTDKIIYKGDTLLWNYRPLENFPDKSLINPQKLFGNSESVHAYVATWEIIDNKLYLIQIRNYSYKNMPASYKGESKNIGNEYADLESLFTDRYKNGKVFADWVTADFYVPLGKLLKGYGNEWYSSTYEFEYKFSIQKGKLEKVEKLDNRKTRETVFSESFGQSDTLSKYIQTKIEWNHLPVLTIDSIIRVILRFSADENGVIDNVYLVKPKMADFFTDEAIRILKTIPWGVRYFHGKPERTWYIIPIRFYRPLDEDEIS
jgi:hypothetical protein